MLLIRKGLVALSIALYAASWAVAAEPDTAQSAKGVEEEKAAAEQKAAQPAKDTAGKKASKPRSKPTEPEAGTANGEDWWRGNYERINKDIKKMNGSIDIAFVGDSLTARWGNGENWQKHWGSYKAVNMGIGGDRTQNVLWRFQNGQLDGYKARLFVLLIGTNNIDKKTTPEEVAEGIKAILEMIKTKQPQAKILLMGIFPTGEKPNPDREKRAAVNIMISKFADNKTVHYMDITDKLLEPDGTITQSVMKDFLHLGSKGFDIWAEAIKDKVKELLGEAKPGQEQ